MNNRNVAGWRLVPLLCLPLLSACVDDRVAAEVGGNQIITLIREQKMPWSDEVDLSMVVARMPTCQRRHSLGTVSAQTGIELWQYRADTFILKVGNRLYATETASCEGLEKVAAPPPEGLGQPLGTFREKDGAFKFVSTPQAPAAAPASVSAAPEAAASAPAAAAR